MKKSFIILSLLIYNIQSIFCMEGIPIQACINVEAEKENEKENLIKNMCKLVDLTRDILCSKLDIGNFYDHISKYIPKTEEKEQIEKFNKDNYNEYGYISETNSIFADYIKNHDLPLEEYYIGDSEKKNNASLIQILCLIYNMQSKIEILQSKHKVTLYFFNTRAGGKLEISHNTQNPSNELLKILTSQEKIFDNTYKAFLDYSAEISFDTWLKGVFWCIKGNIVENIPEEVKKNIKQAIETEKKFLQNVSQYYKNAVDKYCESKTVKESAYAEVNEVIEKRNKIIESETKEIKKCLQI